MAPSVEIAFAYTNDPLVLAALKEFHIYPVNPTSFVRLTTTPIVVSKSNIPTITAPLFVQMTGYANQMVEVLPVDLQGHEGITAHGSVYIDLPPVSGIAQVTG